MKRVLALLLPGLATCGPAPVDRAPRAHRAPDPATLGGRYQEANFDLEGNPAPGWPWLGSLDLRPDGRYEALVLNGITADGCGTFEGAGGSRGTWAIRGTRIVFEPDSEPSDLALSFAGATGELAEEGLLLSIGARERHLVSEEDNLRAGAEWEARSTDGR